VKRRSNGVPSPLRREGRQVGRKKKGGHRRKKSRGGGIGSEITGETKIREDGFSSLKISQEKKSLRRRETERGRQKRRKQEGQETVE